jgi:hypothetical protein
MATQIRIKLCRDPATGKSFRSVYLGRQLVTSRWELHSALECASKLAAITGAQIQSAEVLPFRKVVA